MEVVTLRVSAHGEGLALFLPKRKCETYGIIASDQIKVKMLDHFRNKDLVHPHEDRTVPPNCTIDEGASHKSDRSERAKPGGPDDLP